MYCAIECCAAVPWYMAMLLPVGHARSLTGVRSQATEDQSGKDDGNLHGNELNHSDRWKLSRLHGSRPSGTDLQLIAAYLQHIA